MLHDVERVAIWGRDGLPMIELDKVFWNDQLEPQPIDEWSRCQAAGAPSVATFRSGLRYGGAEVARTCCVPSLNSHRNPRSLPCGTSGQSAGGCAAWAAISTNAPTDWVDNGAAGRVDQAMALLAGAIGFAAGLSPTSSERAWPGCRGRWPSYRLR